MKFKVFALSFFGASWCDRQESVIVTGAKSPLSHLYIRCSPKGSASTSITNFDLTGTGSTCTFGQHSHSYFSTLMRAALAGPTFRAGLLHKFVDGLCFARSLSSGRAFSSLLEKSRGIACCNFRLRFT